MVVARDGLVVAAHLTAAVLLSLRVRLSFDSMEDGEADAVFMRVGGGVRRQLARRSGEDGDSRNAPSGMHACAWPSFAIDCVLQCNSPSVELVYV